MESAEMIEPTVWMQLGISDDRYIAVEQEIRKIISSGKRIGDMSCMIRDCKNFTDDEKLYAMFMVSKYDIVRKLAEVAPFATQVLKNLMENNNGLPDPKNAKGHKRNQF